MGCCHSKAARVSANDDGPDGAMAPLGAGEPPRSPADVRGGGVARVDMATESPILVIRPHAAGARNTSRPETTAVLDERLDDDNSDEDRADAALERLLAARLEPHADVASLDAELSEKFEQEAVFALATMGRSFEATTRAEGVVHTLSLVMKFRELAGRAIAAADGRLVKTEDGAVFALFTRASDALAFAAALLARVAEFSDSARSDSDALAVQVGIASGRCLVLERDVYGTAVNEAAKLAEELGAARLVLVSSAVAHAAQSEGVPAALFDARTADVSEVHFSFARFNWERPLALPQARAPVVGAARRRVAPGSVFSRLCLERLDMGSPLERAMAAEAMGKMFNRRVAVLVSDMSGFTRLSLEYGIAHFLGLVFRMRALCRPHLLAAGGVVVRTQGDDFKVVFPTSAAAITAAAAMLRELAAYNASAEPSVRIDLGMGIAAGTVMVVADECNVFGTAVDCATTLGEECSRAGEVLVAHEADGVVAKHRELASTLGLDARECEHESGLRYCVYTLGN